MWMTNRERLWRFIEDELLPAWGLEHVATWYWVKVRPSDGSTTVPLACMHRHCYEPLLLLRPKGSSLAAAAAAQVFMEDVATPVLPEGFCIFCCPGEHSRKPHLGPLLQALGITGHSGFQSPQPDTDLRLERQQNLELFARELHSGWTSWGNEVLMFNEVSSEGDTA